MGQDDVFQGDDFGARLSLALNASNMSRSELAAALSVDKSVVSRWLSGQITPTSHNLARISTLIAKHKPGFNMTLWTAPRSELEAALGLGGSGVAVPDLQPAAQGDRSAPDRWRFRWIYTALGAAVLFLIVLSASLWAWRDNGNRERQRTGPVQHPAPAAASIAVMPFLNMSGDPAKEYLGDGIAEELLNDLSNTPNLQVVSRTSSFSFKGRSADIGEIARKLHVRAVLEGSARQEGSRIRIVAQLIDAKSGFHLWSASYDRSLGDILAVQSEIAGAIVAALTPKLLPRQPGAIAYHARASVQIDPVAYTTYLQGLYAMKRSNAEEFLKAIDLFKKAIRLQPDFADAHAKLGWAYLALFVNGERRDTLGPAIAEAGAALQLDPDNLTALLADSQIKALAWKWDAADSSMRRLLREHPNNAEAHLNYAIFLENFGLWEKSLLELRRAAELDPLNPGYRDDIAGPLHLLGRDNEAVAQFKQALALDPDFMWGFADLCPAYANMGKLDEAKQILRDRLMPRYREDRATIYCAAVIAYRQHDTNELKRLSRFAESLYARGALGASWVSFPYSFLGDYGNAIRCMEKAYDDRDGNLFFAIADPALPQEMKKTLRWRQFMQRPAFRDIARVRAQILARNN